MAKEIEKEKTNIRPPLSVEATENQIASLATDLLMQRLKDGTATSQEVCTAVKLGSQRAKLEEELMKTEIALKEAKKTQIEHEQKMEELCNQAIDAMMRYSGNTNIGKRND